MGDVKDLKDRTPNPDTIRHLESLLEHAKAGKLRSVVCLAGWDDDCVTHGWSLDHRNTRRRLLAEMVIMQHDYVINLGLDEGSSVLCRALDE